MRHAQILLHCSELSVAAAWLNVGFSAAPHGHRRLGTTAATTACKNASSSGRILFMYVWGIPGSYNTENDGGEAAAAGTQHEEKTPPCGNNSEDNLPASLS